MKRVKLLFLIVLVVITCTGCSIEYNITISEDEVKEVINVNDYVTLKRSERDILNHYNTWYPTYVNFIEDGESIEIENFDEKVDGIEYHQKTQTKTSNGYEYSYNYTYPIEKYYDSYVLASSFVETTVQKTDNTLVLKTGKENILCQYDYFDSATVNITIDPKVYKLKYTNTSNVNNNTYTWVLDRDNCYDSQIILTLDAIDSDLQENLDKYGSGTSSNKDNGKDNNSKDNDVPQESDYTLYIFCGILLVIILIGYFVFTKFKNKNSNFNDD